MTHSLANHRDAIVGSTATWCTMLGFVVAVELSLSVASNLRITTILVALVQLPLVVLLVIAGAGFRRVLRSPGDDASNLLRAIRTLGGLFLARIVLFCLWSALAIVMVVVVLVTDRMTRWHAECFPSRHENESFGAMGIGSSRVWRLWCHWMRGGTRRGRSRRPGISGV